MIRVLMDSMLDAATIKGLIEVGCDACKEGMKKGHGKSEDCKVCKKNEIEYCFKVEEGVYGHL